MKDQISFLHESKCNYFLYKENTYKQKRFQAIKIMISISDNKIKSAQTHGYLQEETFKVRHL